MIKNDNRLAKTIKSAVVDNWWLYAIFWDTYTNLNKSSKHLKGLIYSASFFNNNNSNAEIVSTRIEIL